MGTGDGSLHLGELLKNESVVTFFQPLVSIKKKSIVGFEALNRGKHPEDGSLIAPDMLFACAAREGLVLQLDRLCRKKAVESFDPIRRLGGDHILSINIDPAILNEENVGSNHLLDLAASWNLRTERILIEIIESEIGDIGALVRFAETYRRKGFLLALDDIGSGLSNLDRITLVKPDILKIDKLFMRGIHEYHGREIIRSIVNLAHRIGSLVIAEGIETEEDAHAALGLDVDVLQGYYFSRPMEDVIPWVASIQEKTESAAMRFKEYAVARIAAKKKLHERYNKVVDAFILDISKCDNNELNSVLKSLVRSNPLLECAYILDEYGVQISDTVFYSSWTVAPRSFLFHPGVPGTDQSSKDYFFLVSAGLPRYTTDPYISLASGHICITLSAQYRDKSEQKRVLCLDILHENA